MYLIRAQGANVLVDSGSFHHRESIRTRLERCTHGEGLQAIILSHTDYPHAANVSAFRSKWGDIEIIASSDVPEIQGLPYATRSKVGETMDIQGRQLSFIDPPLADRSHTSWIYDHGSRVMFTADGFGNFHRAHQCTLTSADGRQVIAVDEIENYHREAISWLKYVEPDRVLEALRSILDAYPVSFIAPVHGNPIARQDVDWYLDRLYEAVVTISGR